MLNKISPLFAAIMAVGAWALFIICDVIDEFVIDASTCLGLLAIFIVPFVMLAWYIKYYKRERPRAAMVTLWFVIYLLLFSGIMLYVYGSGVIFQRSRSENGLDLNGIEYFGYFLTTSAGFFIMCMIFHIIHAAGNAAKKKRDAQVDQLVQQRVLEQLRQMTPQQEQQNNNQQ